MGARTWARCAALALAQLAGACAATQAEPTAPPRSASEAATTRAARAADPDADPPALRALFPATREPLRIEVNEAGEAPTYAWLVEELERIGGVHLLSSPETRHVLNRKALGLLSTLEIEPESVWPTANALLRAGDFALVQSGSSPSLLSVVSLDTNERNAVRAGARNVAPEDLEAYARYPALLVRTVIELPHLDVRTLANSLRTILTDANTEQIVPLGATDALLVVGFSDCVHDVVALVRTADEQAAREPAPPAAPPPPPVSETR